MLKALAAFAAISVNSQPPCCSDAVQCDEYMKLCLSGTQTYCDILHCTSSSSCNPCPRGGNVVNGKCVDSISITADGMCPAGYIFNPVNALCEMSYPPAQDCPSPSSNKCCNDATDECMILARKCASGDLTACGFVPCAPSPSFVETRESSSMTPKVAEPLYTRKPDCNFWSCPAKYEVTNLNGKVICKYYNSADYNSIQLPDSPEGNSGGFYNEYYCPTGTKLITIQGAVEAKKYWCEGVTDAIWSACPSVSSTPSMTLRIVPSSNRTSTSTRTATSSISSTSSVVPSSSASPTMTAKVVAERTQSSSMTLKVVDRESSSPTMTAKVVAERTQSSSMTLKVVPSSSSSPTMTLRIVPSSSSSPTMTLRIVPSSSASMTPKVVPSSSASMTPKVVPSSSASMTPKVVSERTVSSSARPSNVDVFEYTNRPAEPLYTRKPDCNFWSCPAEYEVTNINGKVICKYYKSAEYNQITLPEGPEGQTGGFYNEYYCPRGTKLITIQGAVEAEKYWCEGFTDAVWSPCPSVSSTPTMTYKNNVPSSIPNRSPIRNASTTGAFPSRRVSPPMSPKFSKFPWFTPVMTKKPLFGTSISGALTFPRASITTIDKIKELQVHLACMFHVDIEKVSITSVVRYINGTEFNVPFDISTLSAVEVPLIGCYKVDAPSPALARMLQSVNGDIVVNYVMTDSTAEILTVDPTVLQAAIASDPAIIDFASSVGSSTINSSANMHSSEESISTSNNNANFGAITGIAVVFGAILAVVGVVSATKYAQHRRRVAKNSKVIRFEDENSRRNPITYDTTKQMFTPTPAVNYII